MSSTAMRKSVRSLPQRFSLKHRGASARHSTLSNPARPYPMERSPELAQAARQFRDRFARPPAHAATIRGHGRNLAPCSGRYSALQARRRSKRIGLSVNRLGSKVAAQATSSPSRHTLETECGPEHLRSDGCKPEDRRNARLDHYCASTLRSKSAADCIPPNFTLTRPRRALFDIVKRAGADLGQHVSPGNRRAGSATFNRCRRVRSARSGYDRRSAARSKQENF